MPDNPRESSFMVTAEHEVDRLVRAARWGKAVVSVLIAAMVGLGFLYWQQHTLIDRLHQQSVVTCNAGNSYKYGDLQNWQLFMQVALGPHPTKDSVSKAAEILRGIAGRDRPRDCSKLTG